MSFELWVLGVGLLLSMSFLSLDAALVCQFLAGPFYKKARKPAQGRKNLTIGGSTIPREGQTSLLTAIFRQGRLKYPKGGSTILKNTNILTKIR